MSRLTSRHPLASLHRIRVIGMNTTDWQNLVLDDGVLRVAGAPVTRDQGLCSTAATSSRVRQRTGVIGLFLRRVWRTSAERNWKLPNGTTAEQWGERRINLLLVRSEEEGACIDE